MSFCIVIFKGFMGEVRLTSSNTTLGALPCLPLFDCVLGPLCEGLATEPDLRKQRDVSEQPQAKPLDKLCNLSINSIPFLSKACRVLLDSNPNFWLAAVSA